MTNPVQSTVLDAGVIICMMNSNDAHHETAVEALKQVLTSESELSMSAVTLSEVLVAPSRHGSQLRDDVKYSVTDILGIAIVDVDESMAERIAEIRAIEKGLTTPDAAVVATARMIGANQILTTDERLAKISDAVTPKQMLGT